MIIDDTINQFIDTYLINEQLGRDHKSSGKLSAGILGWTTQWQILKYLKHPEKPIDTYLLRKFRRGKDVEDFIIKRLAENKHGVRTQEFIEYKGCIGYIDAIVKTSDLQFKGKSEYIPIEVKSVTNMKYRRILKLNEADPQHKLQAGLYALGLKVKQYAICYVASDDYRTHTLIYETNDVAQEIRDIIVTYNHCLKTEHIPAFEPKYPWHEKPDYNPYPDMIGKPKIRFSDYKKGVV